MKINKNVAKKLLLKKYSQTYFVPDIIKRLSIQNFKAYLN